MVIDWNHYRVRLGDIGRNRWPPGLAGDPGWAANPTVTDQDLWYVWTGQGQVRLRERWTELRPGVCLWLRPGWRYEISQNPQQPLGMNFIHFDLVDETGRSRSRRLRLPPERIEPFDPLFAEVLSRHIVESCFGLEQAGYSKPPYPPVATAIATAALTTLLMELDAASDSRARQPGAALAYQDRWIRQVALRIAENPQHLPPVGKLAREYGYSPDHFTRLFKAAAGQTPELYAVQARIHRAQQLLRQTTLGIGEIAATLGYRDIYFFSRQFKQFTRLSPRQYRQRHSG